MAAKKKAAKKPAGRKAPGTRQKAKPARKAVPKAKAAARERRRQPETLRIRAVAPSLTVSDLKKSIAWYCDVLGFVIKDRWERDGELRGVEIAAGATIFMLGQDDWKLGRDRKKGEGFRFYCSTAQDVDALASAIKSRGGVLAQEPTDQPWGSRDFALVDPDGFKITIAKDA